MDEGEDAKAHSKSSMESKKENHTSKKRKVVEKTVVRVRIDENAGKQKGDGPPSDTWSWRKYGQKPIKGSPYPRGYYRCSTSKGCSAKKQVERCRSDGSVFIITYTSAHNHRGPDTHLNNSTQPPNQCQPTTDAPTIARDPAIINEKDSNVNSHFQSTIKSPSDSSHDSPPTTPEKAHNNPLSIPHDEQPNSYSGAMAFSTPKSEENDFFDELEDLPISSSFTSLMRSFFDERILA